MRKDVKNIIFIFIIYPVLIVSSFVGVFIGQLFISIPFMDAGGEVLIFRDMLLYTLPFIFQLVVILFFVHEEASCKKTFLKVLSVPLVYFSNFLSIGFNKGEISGYFPMIDIGQVILPVVNIFIALVFYKVSLIIGNAINS